MIEPEEAALAAMKITAAVASKAGWLSDPKEQPLSPAEVGESYATMFLAMYAKILKGTE